MLYDKPHLVFVVIGGSPRFALERVIPYVDHHHVSFVIIDADPSSWYQTVAILRKHGVHVFEIYPDLAPLEELIRRAHDGDPEAAEKWNELGMPDAAFGGAGAAGNPKCAHFLAEHYSSEITQTFLQADSVVRSPTNKGALDHENVKLQSQTHVIVVTGCGGMSGAVRSVIQCAQNAFKGQTMVTVLCLGSTSYHLSGETLRKQNVRSYSLVQALSKDRDVLGITDLQILVSPPGGEATARQTQAAVFAYFIEGVHHKTVNATLFNSQDTGRLRIGVISGSAIDGCADVIRNLARAITKRHILRTFLQNKSEVSPPGIEELYFSPDDIFQNVKANLENELRAANRGALQRIVFSRTNIDSLSQMVMEAAAKRRDELVAAMDGMLGAWAAKAVSDDGVDLVKIGGILGGLDSVHRKYINEQIKTPAVSVPPPAPPNMRQFREAARSNDPDALLHWSVNRLNTVMQHYQSMLNGQVARFLAQSMDAIPRSFNTLRQRLLRKATPLLETLAVLDVEIEDLQNRLTDRGPWTPAVNLKKVAASIDSQIREQEKALMARFRDAWLPNDLSDPEDEDDLSESLQTLLNGIAEEIAGLVQRESLTSLLIGNKDKAEALCREALSYVSDVDRVLTVDAGKNSTLSNHIVLLGRRPASSQLFKILNRCAPAYLTRDQLDRANEGAHFIIRDINDLKIQDVRLIQEWAAAIQDGDDLRLGQYGVPLDPHISGNGRRKIFQLSLFPLDGAAR